MLYLLFSGVCTILLLFNMDYIVCCFPVGNSVFLHFLIQFPLIGLLACRCQPEPPASTPLLRLAMGWLSLLPAVENLRGDMQ